MGRAEWAIQAAMRAAPTATENAVRFTKRPRRQSAEKKRQVFRPKVANQAVVGGDNGPGEAAFCVLKLENLLFVRIPCHEPVGENRSRLADAVSAVDLLHLDSGIPPWIEPKDAFRRGQVESHTAGLQADHKELAIGIVLKAFDLGLPVARVAVQLSKWDLHSLKPGFQDGKHRSELRKDQGLVTFFEHLIETGQERLELDARLVPLAGTDQSRMDGGLPEAQQRHENVNLVFPDALAFDPLQELPAVVVKELIVKAAVRLIQLAANRLFDLVGRVLGHLRLGSAQDERPQGVGKQFARGHVNVLFPSEKKAQPFETPNIIQAGHAPAQ